MENSIDSLLTEKARYAPPESFSAHAHIQSMAAYQKIYDEAAKDPDAFWLRQSENLSWVKKPTKALTWNAPFARWFEDGRLNASVQCLDRHLKSGGQKTALIWEGEPGDTRAFSYQELADLTNQAANALKEMGVVQGDRIALYLPMIPEAVAAMLACARLGAAHSVIFGGFSSESLKDRINDAQCKVVITSDGGYRRGSVLALKENVDAALVSCPSVKHVLVVKRTKNPVTMKAGRDHWWHEIVEKQAKHCEPVAVESENLLFILYTSGTTGKPKGIMHSTAGFMVNSYLTTKWVFDMKPQDLYWCTADIGWVTGHSYVVYGPLANGATIFLYEGAPNHPDFGRFWQMIEKHKITIMYTAPTAIRAFMKAGDSFVTGRDLSSLRLLGSVGEPINPEAWLWYHKIVGRERCPIVDTWWQTETGAIMMSPLPGATPTKPGSCTFPLPGIQPRVVRKDGTPCKPNEGGFLIIEKPWPGMMRGIYNDPERYQKTYWSDFKGKYFSGDGARQDQDGYFWVMGRVDDVLNVAGHRLSTAEVESALASHPRVAEAAAVGRPDAMKGQALVAFVTLKTAHENTNPAPEETKRLSDELKAHVAKEIGAIARPDEIRFTEALPKTRSGKIMRRLLRELAAHGQVSGDTTTLEDVNVINKLASSYGDED